MSISIKAYITYIQQLWILDCRYTFKSTSIMTIRSFPKKFVVLIGILISAILLYYYYYQNICKGVDCIHTVLYEKFKGQFAQIKPYQVGLYLYNIFILYIIIYDTTCPMRDLLSMKATQEVSGYK